MVGADLAAAAPVILAAATVIAVVWAVWQVYNFLFDPSGNVLDTTGNPISGATATIVTAPSRAGPFSPVDADSGAIAPAINPQTTDASGGFDWDAIAGTY